LCGSMGVHRDEVRKEGGAAAVIDRPARRMIGKRPPSFNRDQREASRPD
jgi:hypothetical protein